MNLTDHTLKRLRVETAKRITYSDDALPGFGVRVTAKGAKTFVLLVGRQRKRITIGRYPMISLKEARARARELVAERLLGKDDVPSMKFEDAIPIFLASRYGDNYIRPRTRDEVERLLRRHFLPKFRYEQLSVIKPHEIADIIDKLRRTPSIAHHAFGAIHLFFRWAEGRRYVLRGPCATLQPPKPSRPRERVLAKEEIRILLRVVRAQTSTFATIVELLLLTGQRRGEIAGLRAKWIDWKRIRSRFQRPLPRTSECMSSRSAIAQNICSGGDTGKDFYFRRATRTERDLSTGGRSANRSSMRYWVSLRGLFMIYAAPLPPTWPGLEYPFM